MDGTGLLHLSEVSQTVKDKYHMISPLSGAFSVFHARLHNVPPHHRAIQKAFSGSLGPARSVRAYSYLLELQTA